MRAPGDGLLQVGKDTKHETMSTPLDGRRAGKMLSLPVMDCLHASEGITQ